MSAEVEASFYGPDDGMFSIVKLIPFGNNLWINRAEGMVVKTESGTEVLLRFHRNAWRTLAPLFALAWVAIWSAVYLTNPTAAETVPPWLAAAMGPALVAFLEWRRRALSGDDKKFLLSFLLQTLQAEKVDNPA